MQSLILTLVFINTILCRPVFLDNLNPGRTPWWFSNQKHIDSSKDGEHRVNVGSNIELSLENDPFFINDHLSRNNDVPTWGLPWTNTWFGWFQNVLDIQPTFDEPIFVSNNYLTRSENFEVLTETVDDGLEDEKDENAVEITVRSFVSFRLKCHQYGHFGSTFFRSVFSYVILSKCIF